MPNYVIYNTNMLEIEILLPNCSSRTYELCIESDIGDDHTTYVAGITLHHPTVLMKSIFIFVLSRAMEVGMDCVTTSFADCTQEEMESFKFYESIVDGYEILETECSSDKKRRWLYN